MKELKSLSLVLLLSLQFSLLPIKAATARPSTNVFKFGKAKYQIKPDDVQVRIDQDGKVLIVFLGKKSKSQIAVAFDFHLAGLDLNTNYKIRTTAQAQNLANDEVLLEFAELTKKKKATRSHRISEASIADGNLLITQLDRETKTLAGQFNFISNVLEEKTNKKGIRKTRNKNIKLEGSFAIEAGNLPANFFLADNGFFAAEQTFFPEGIDSSIQGDALNGHAATYTVDGKKIFVTHQDVNVEIIDDNFTKISLESISLDKKSKSTLSFLLHNDEIRERARFRIFKGPLIANFANVTKDRAIASIDQTHRDLPEGIREIRRVTTNQSERSGNLEIISFDGQRLFARFDFSTDLQFTNLSSDNQFKGPLKRSLVVRDGVLDISL